MTARAGTKFVVLTSQRSGSTWLVDILNHRTDVTARTELFLPQRRPPDKRLMTERTAEYLDEELWAYPRFSEANSRRVMMRPFSVATYLREFYNSPGTIGFKLMYSNLLRYPEVWAYISLRRLHVIHFIRRNHLDVALSEEMRKATRTYHRIADEPAPPPVSVKLDVKDLLKRMRRSRRNIKIARSLLRLCRLPHIEVVYENLVENSLSFDRICQFLSINREGEAPRSQLAKLVRGNYSEIISNYAEVREALAETEFAALLHDPPHKSARPA